MLRRMLHAIVAKPMVYDMLQTAVGAKAVRRRLAAQVQTLPPAKWVIDLGGGTGLNATLWPNSVNYVCLDMDPLKLSGLAHERQNMTGVLGDATATPFGDGIADAVICTAVSHHIPDEPLPRLFAEAFRILRPGGHFIFFDAVWKPRRVPSRMLWHYDRGSYPRPAERLRTLISAYGNIVKWDQFKILHEYVLCTAVNA